MKSFTILCLSFFFVIKLAAQQGEYFEGYVDYKTEFKSNIPGVSDKELQLRMGHFIRIYFKEGNFKWVITDDAGFLKAYTNVDQKTNLYYSWSADSPDTIYSFNLNSTKRISIESIEDVDSDTVLGCKCKVGKFTGTSFFENPDFNMPTIYWYYFCPDLKVNPANYKNYKEMRWNEIVSKYKSVAIKIVTDMGQAINSTFTATSYKSEKVDPAIFVIDKTKFIKPTFVN